MLAFLESKSLITKMIIPITHTIHVLIMVRPSYFQSKKDYITQKEWGNLWSQSLKVDYAPVVDVGAVKEKGKGVKGAILETAKYPTKPIKLDIEISKW